MSSDGFNGAGPLAIDFDRDGALKQGDGSDEAEAVLELDDEAFDTGQRAALDADLLAFAKKGVRFDVLAETQHGLDGENLFGGDRGEQGAEAHNADHAGRIEDRDAMGGIKAAEHVAGKQGRLDFLGAVRPTAARTDLGEEVLVAFGLEQGGSYMLAVRTDPDGIPFQEMGSRTLK
jgi:hypothetical protein